jgi:hypothetical protein
LVCLGFFVYGKKQKVADPLFSGLGLMIYPYFVSSTFFLSQSGPRSSRALFRQGATVVAR